MRLLIVPARTLEAVPLGQHAVDKFLSLFVNPLKSKDVVLSIAKLMEEEFKKVLVGHKSFLKKTYTFIQDFPDGKENGEFLGVHFEHGIINMAGLKVDGLKTLNSIHETIVVPEEERLLRGTERVRFVAHTLKNFSRRLRAIELPDIGPMWHIGVNHGYLKVEGRFGLTSLDTLSWPDEYNFTGKPVRMLSLGKQIIEAADSIGFNVDIKGFLHTPEAVFLDGCWKHSNLIGSLSLDHRCISCIKVKTSQVGRISYKDDDKPFILLKIFWESFGNGGELDFILNEFDKHVDLTSRASRVNAFEQIVSEEYIIKLVRVVLLAMTKEGLLFGSNEENKLKLEEYLQEMTHCISSMSRSYSRGMWDHLIRTFRFESLDVEEVFVIKRVVEVISWRASLILATVVAVHLRFTSGQIEEPIFFINGNHSENEIRDIVSALKYVMGLLDNNVGSKGKVLFTSQSQVFGAAVLAAIFTKNPFDYDKDFSDIAG